MSEQLFYGGDILPLTEPNLPAPEGLLVRDGRIAALGAVAELSALAPQAEPVDLGGAALMPAFVDAHSHLSSYATSLLQLDLSGAKNFAELQQAIRERIDVQRLAPGAWLTACGYDHNRLAERRHPDKALLDAVSPQNPVLLQHASGHVGVLNSAGLAALGITADTPVPAGGEIGLLGGEPTGYLAEGAFVEAAKRVPMPGAGELLNAYREAQRRYASYGIATVQEGLMPREMLPLYGALLQSGLLRLDVVGYPELAAAEEYRSRMPEFWHGYRAHFRLGGYKILLDGSPQARTAWMTEPYENVPGTGPEPEHWCGAPAMETRAVCAAAEKAAADHVQLLAHCNGDAAAQQFLDACEIAAARDPRVRQLRYVMIHAQLVRHDQLVLAKELGIIPSFFVAHVYHWGDIHLRNFGSERAQRISPANTARQLGIPFTFHQDSPVIPPDMLETVWCAANRQTKAGVTLGPEECIPVWDALRAVTANAAYQYGEETEKGTLAVGKRADLAVLSASPLKVAPRDLRRLEVLATYKDGEEVYRR